MDGGTEVVVPCGQIGRQASVPAGAPLNYDEFIVYRESQAKLKYLVMVKFNYNKK